MAAVEVAPLVDLNARGISLDHMSRIPDPIKSLPAFDGSRKQLSAWLTTAKNTLLLVRDHVDEFRYNMYVSAVTNKIQGKANDIICLAGNPQSFEEVKDIIITALGNRQELSTYKSQLWQNYMSANLLYTVIKQKLKN